MEFIVIIHLDVGFYIFNVQFWKIQRGMMRDYVPWHKKTRALISLFTGNHWHVNSFSPLCVNISCKFQQKLKLLTKPLGKSANSSSFC